MMDLPEEERRGPDRERIRERERVWRAKAELGPVRHRVALFPEAFSEEDRERILRRWVELDAAALEYLKEDVEEGVPGEDADVRVSNREALVFIRECVLRDSGADPSTWAGILEHFDAQSPGWREAYRRRLLRDPTPNGVAILVRREPGGRPRREVGIGLLGLPMVD